ncbi:MAG: tellurite-like stress resistance cysteine protease StiP [Neisseria sp.]|nr:tellurite-like stress resistance cysteine protease StiP [Neisseria sp.]
MSDFHGSYLPHQVTFLLQPITLEPMTDLAEKERLIQSGRRHYSEMLSPEPAPSEAYLRLFQAACGQNLPRMAAGCLQLAAQIAAGRENPVLVSLARAGTPPGVALQHILSRHYGREVPHYSISIIRDRGIDQNALRHILRRHDAAQLVFVDGWTGKGVIKRELDKFLAAFNRQNNCSLPSDLYVLSDLAGVTPYAASRDDYLIPSAILNACISGLVSRSVLNEKIGANDFHGCVYLEDLAAHDLSRRFIAELTAVSGRLQQNGLPAAQFSDPAPAAALSSRFIAHAARRYGISDINLIKPGIGEATRVMLRRRPRLLLLRDPASADVVHLLQLAEEKNTAVETDAALPYQAAALIQDLRHA